MTQATLNFDGPTYDSALDGVSARVRELRMERHGSHTVLRRRRSRGTWEYTIPKEAGN